MAASPPPLGRLQKWARNFTLPVRQFLCSESCLLVGNIGRYCRCGRDPQHAFYRYRVQDVAKAWPGLCEPQEQYVDRLYMYVCIRRRAPYLIQWQSATRWQAERLTVLPIQLGDQIRLASSSLPVLDAQGGQILMPFPLRPWGP